MGLDVSSIEKDKDWKGLYAGHTDGSVIVFDCGIQLIKPHYELAVLFACNTNYDNANRVWLKPKSSALNFYWQTRSTERYFGNMSERGKLQQLSN